MRKEDEARICSEVSARVFNAVLVRAGPQLNDSLAEVINETLHHEGERLRSTKADGDVAADRRFYGQIRRRLPTAGETVLKGHLRAIIERYTQEICGHFNPRVYALSTRALPMGLSALLNGLSPARLLNGFRDLRSVDTHIRIDGETDRLMALAEHGTLVFAPTHVSNLDSLVLGYAIYRLGLPPAIYGAGLNLFGNPIVGSFMSNLGAYTVDRRKKAALYKRTLKEYATVSMEMGYNNLFFPGGTRSRSGAVEDRLKKGLLGTTLQAYANNLRFKKDNPRIFVVPCNLSFPLVLEASTLVDDYLKREGKARYIIVDDEFSRWQRWAEFGGGLFRLDAQIHLRVGKAFDPFGNEVDGAGQSFDPRGRSIQPERYLMRDGQLVSDPARDREYTRVLSERIQNEMRDQNLPLSTHIVAFAVFEALFAASPQADLYRFLRSLGPETNLPMAAAIQATERVLQEIRAASDAGRMIWDPEVHGDGAPAVVRSALRSFGVYHKDPVLHRVGDRLHVGDANLLFYYRNRLDGYGFLDVEERVGERSW